MFMLVPPRRAVACAVALILSGAAASALAQTQSFDLQSQPAVNAIPMFARQAGIQIVAPAGKLDGINTQAVHGAMDRHQALAKLLEGTPLVVSSDDGKVVILQLADPAPQPAPAKSKPQVVNTPAPDRPMEEVVVSGYVESLEQARAIKRNAVGSEEAIVAAESANNATTGGTLIPILTLGISGGLTDSILLGALVIHNLQPGPLLYKNNPEIVNTIFATHLVAHLAMFALMTFGITGFVIWEVNKTVDKATRLENLRHARAQIALLEGAPRHLRRILGVVLTRSASRRVGDRLRQTSA